MTWAKIDDRFHSHPKVEEAGLAAAGLFARGLSYAACYETEGKEGFLPESWVRKERAAPQVKKLLEVGLWETVDGGYIIHDWLDYNKTAEQRKELSKTRAAAGRKGGLARARSQAIAIANPWQPPKQPPGSGRVGSGATREQLRV